MTSEGLGKLGFVSKSIGLLIRNHLTVPLNQREYAWETKHVEDILHDITAAMAEGLDEYFLGTIVLAGSEGEPYVVDGQQRISTVIIIISAIRHYLENTGSKENKERAQGLETRYLYNKDLTTLDIEPFFTLNETDNAFFVSSILGKKIDFTQIDKTKPSHTLLKNAYEIVYGYITEIAKAPPSNDVAQLMEIVDYLEKSVKVLVVHAANEANAFVLFETLNDRGLDLAVTDLLKNYLFGRSGKKIDTVKKHWASMQSALEAVDAADKTTLYIMHLWCSKYGVARERGLFAAIKGEIKSPIRSVDFVVNLATEVKNYIAILTVERKFWKNYGDEVWRSIQALYLLKQVQPRPLILAILLKFPRKNVGKALEVIESMAVRFSVTSRLGGQKIEKYYSDLALDISKEKLSSAKDLIKRASNMVPTDEDFKDSFSKISCTRPALARYYLIELEKTKLGPGNLETIPNEDTDELNLEHVLPKTFPDDGWENFTPDDHRIYNKRLGNMALMKSDDNVSADKDSFSAKLKFYEKSDILTTKELTAYNSWTKEAIQNRQNDLAKLAVKRWK